MKALVRQWMREEFEAGKLDNLPDDVVAALKAEAEARKEVVVPAFQVKAEQRDEEA